MFGVQAISMGAGIAKKQSPILGMIQNALPGPAGAVLKMSGPMGGNRNLSPHQFPGLSPTQE